MGARTSQRRAGRHEDNHFHTAPRSDHPTDEWRDRATVADEATDDWTACVPGAEAMTDTHHGLTAGEIADRLTDEHFPEHAQSTHYEGCWKFHPDCAYHRGVTDAVPYARGPWVRRAGELRDALESVLDEVRELKELGDVG